MGNINVSRVFLGGLVAGLVVNVANFIGQMLFAEQGEEMFARLGLEPPGGAQVAIFIVFSFVFGIALVWLYAAIRPRFGAGIQTAIMAGVAVWFFSSFSMALMFHVLGILAMGEFVVGTIFDVIVVSIAAIAGAWLYQEHAA